VLFKFQPKLPSRAQVIVRHSDGEVEVLDEFDVYEPPFGMVEKSYEVSAKTAGDEVVIFRLSRLFPDPVQAEEFSVTVPVREFPTRVVIVWRGAVARRVVSTRTTTLPMVRKIDRLGVLGDYRGYERELRSVFRVYRLYFGSRLERNIVLKKVKKPDVYIASYQNLYIRGNLEKALPLLPMYADYFRSNIYFGHYARYFGGDRIA